MTLGWEGLKDPDTVNILNTYARTFSAGCNSVCRTSASRTN